MLSFTIKDISDITLQSALKSYFSEKIMKWFEFPVIPTEDKMVIQESTEPVTEFPYFQASKNPLIQCLLCECSTLEESLKAHIQYNHMIYKDQILKVGFFFQIKNKIMKFSASGSLWSSLPPREQEHT